MSSENVSTVNNATVNDDRHDDVESARSPSSPSTYSTAANCSSRDSTNLSFSSPQGGGDQHSSIRATRSDPADTTCQIQKSDTHSNSQKELSDSASSRQSETPAEAEDYQSKERRARWIRDKMSNYPNQTDNLSGYNHNRVNNLPHDDVEKAAGEEVHHSKHNPLLQNHYRHLYKQYQNAHDQQDSSGGFRELPQKTGIDSSEGSNWISENDSKGSRFHRPYSLREQRSWRSAAQASSTPGFGSASADINRTIADESNKQRVRAGLSLPVEKSKRFQDFLENELVDPRQEEDDEQEDPEEEDDEIGQITDPSSYYLTRHKRLAYPYPRKGRNPSSDNSDANDLSRNLDDSGVIGGLDRSPSQCSISSESDSQGDCENALDPPRLTLANGVDGGGGYFVGGGSATNGRKFSVLFASHDVWSEESIIQSFKELGPTVTSLFEAAWGGKLLELEEILKDEEIVKKLKESEIRDGSLRTPLHLSAACAHVKCVELLLSKGAEVNVYDGNKATPLSCAASCGSVEVIQVLLNHGANVNAGFEQGKTALSWAIQAGSVECAKILLEAGAKQNSAILYSETPLHKAAACGDAVCVKLLLDHGADVNLCKEGKSTALHLAAEEGSASCVRLLLQAGASHAAKDIRGHTALHVAATCDADTVLALLKSGADPNAVDANGRNPLHCAVARGSRAAECVRLLVENGADIDAQDNYGYTPLHLAAVNESSQCASILLHHGSNVTLKTNAGTNALSLLVRRIPDVMRYLVERLDSAVTIHDHDPADPDCEIRLDFRAIVPNCEKRVGNNGKPNGVIGGESSSSSGGGSGVIKRGGGGGGQVDNKGDVYFQKPHKETEFLTCLMAAGNKKILNHPLVETFLTLKWRVVRKFFWASLLFQIALVALFTIYVVEIYLIRCPYHREPHEEHPSAEPFHNEAGFVNEGIEIITPAPPVPPRPPDMYPMTLASSTNDTDNPSSLPVSPSNYNSTSRSKRAADPEPIPEANGFQWFSVTPKKNKTRKRFRQRKNDSLSLQGTETRNWKQRRPAAAPPSVPHEKLGRTRSEEGTPSNFEYTHTAAEAPGNEHEEREEIHIARMEPIRCRLTPTLHVIWILLVSFASLLALKEIFQLIQSPISYVTSSENWGQWLLISSVTLTAFNTPNQDFHLEYWQYPAAACGIFLAWGLMLLQVGRFPSLGLYVQMLGKVAANFGLFILAYACLLIAFALSFCVLFPESPPYSSVAVSILKVFTMMVGEVDYEDLFYNEQRIHDPILFPITAHLLYGAFVIIVTIVLMNLLVGLAVHDIQGLQKGAKLNKLSRQTALVSRLESFIFSKKLQKILPRTLGSLLQRSAMLVPSSYNWSYYFRPNDPRDKRLPKDIKQASLRLAASRHSSSKTKSHRVHSQNSNHQSHQPVETKPLATPRPVSSTSHHANANVVHHHHHADASIRRVEQRLDHLQNQLEMVLATLNGRMDSVLGALQEQNDTRSRLRLSFERSNSDNNFDIFQPEVPTTTDRSFSTCTNSPTPSPGVVNWRKPTFPDSPPSVLKDVSTEKG